MIKDKDESGSDTNQITVIKDEPLTPENIKKEIDSNEHNMNIEDECSTSNSKKTVTKLPTNNKDSLIHDTLVNDNDLSNIIAVKCEDNADLTLSQDSFSNLSHNLSNSAQTHVSLSNQQSQQLQQLQQQHHQQQQQTPPHLTPDNIQPLPSNIINRHTNNIEVQYMQQQSQIFVFSTILANKGADAVLKGHYQSIIAYHCAQPGTQKFLEKNPLKTNQFNRQNANTWMNNMPVNRTKNCLRNNNNNDPNRIMLGNKRPSSLDGLIGADALDDMVSLSETDLQWDQKNNAINTLENLGNGSLLSDMEQSTCMLQNPNVNNSLSSSNSMNNQMLSNLQPSLQGVKVPDENLTPQQRQHREEQLATIRNLQQMLLPENQSMNLDMASLADNQESNDLVPANISNILDPSADDKAALCKILGGILPTQQQQQRSMSNMISYSNRHLQQHTPPLSQQQLEWKKLPNQFLDERKMKNSVSGPGPSPGLGPGPGPEPGSGKNNFQNVANSRIQGPPPPYHQATRSASVPIALQSPNPMSPINPTSNISLPSPRASSAVSSPSTEGTRNFPVNKPSQQQQQHKSPNNSQDSPSKLLSQSNPTTPISSHLSPSNSNPILEFTTGSINSTTTPTSNSNGMFSNSLSQKPNMPLSMLGSKEANLMPVPSPQQISYLNTFDGQELTIQKQPNTSLKDGAISTPPLDETVKNTNKDCSVELETGQFSTLTSVSESCQFSRTSPQQSTVTTTSSNISTNNISNNVTSIITTGAGTGTGTGTATTPTNASNIHVTHKTDILTQSSNNLTDNSCYSMLVNDCNSFAPQQSKQQQQQSQTQSQNQTQPQSHSQHQNFPSHHHFLDKQSTNDGNFNCMRTDNVPLNPNSSTNLLGNSKVPHFDPISSLAQMSQLLSNTSTNSINNPATSNPNTSNSLNMMMFNPQNSVNNMMNMNDLPSCHNSLDFENMMLPTHHSPNGHPFNPNSNQMTAMNSLSPKMVAHLPYPATTTLVTTTAVTTTISMNPPSMSPINVPVPRMMARSMTSNHSFNGTNVQVKPNAPNTIQYLPAKPQMENSNPRGPPSLEFLHRFTNPVQNMDQKMSPQHMQYFPPCNASGPNHVNHLNSMNHMDAGPPPHMATDNMMISGGGHPCRNNMMGQPPLNMNVNMIRNVPPLRSGPGIFSGPGPGPGPGLSPGNGPMMRMPPMNFNHLNHMNPTDATQPLPPSMNQNNFKNAHFSGPTTSDPNYAQQFLNFQQQLYATTTNRNPMNNTIMNAGPHHKF